MRLRTAAADHVDGALTTQGHALQGRDGAALAVAGDVTAWPEVLGLREIADANRRPRLRSTVQAGGVT